MSLHDMTILWIYVHFSLSLNNLLVLIVLYLIDYNVQSADLGSTVFKLCLSIAERQHDRDSRIQRLREFRRMKKNYKNVDYKFKYLNIISP